MGELFIWAITAADLPYLPWFSSRLDNTNILMLLFLYSTLDGCLRKGVSFAYAGKTPTSGAHHHLCFGNGQDLYLNGPYKPGNDVGIVPIILWGSNCGIWSFRWEFRIENWFFFMLLICLDLLCTILSCNLMDWFIDLGVVWCSAKWYKTVWNAISQ